MIPAFEVTSACLKVDGHTRWGIFHFYLILENNRPVRAYRVQPL